MKRLNKAEKRREIAKKIVTEWHNRGFKPEQGEYAFMADNLGDFAVALMEEAAKEGYNFSTSQYDPVWNSAMNCLYDAYRTVRDEWEQQVLLEYIERNYKERK